MAPGASGLPVRSGEVTEAESPSILIVPGFTPPWARRPTRLHALLRWRLRLALRWLHRWPSVPVVVTGGAVYPAGTDVVEAHDMAKALRDQGVDDGRIVIEPRARHSTTNLRNAARLMFQRGHRVAMVVTDPGQAFYLGVPHLSGFGARYVRELGHHPGHLRRHGWTEVLYVPHADVAQLGPDTLDP